MFFKLGEYLALFISTLKGFLGQPPVSRFTALKAAGTRAMTAFSRLRQLGSMPVLAASSETPVVPWRKRQPVHLCCTRLQRHHQHHSHQMLLLQIKHPFFLELSSPLHCGHAPTQTFRPLALLLDHPRRSISCQQQSRSRFLNDLPSPLFQGSSSLPLRCHRLPTPSKQFPPGPLGTNKLGGWLLRANSLVHIWEGKRLPFPDLMAALTTISFQKGSKESSRESGCGYCEESW